MNPGLSGAVKARTGTNPPSSNASHPSSNPMPAASDLLKGAAAGLVAGLVASFVMERFQAAVPADVFKKLLGEPEEDDASDSSGGEPATVKTAEAISKAAAGHELTKEEKSPAGEAVHYGFGSANAVLYSVVAEAAPAATLGGGLPFGALVWLFADEGAVPALGLSKAPWKYPASTHLYSLASHLVFGLTTEAVRRLARRLI